MNASSLNFETRVTAYAEWRQQVAQAVRRYEQWLGEHGLGDPSLKARLDQILQRLKEERMSIAFVAEFSRGKSELINALFFSGYGRRMLPSAAGRTTMCPTELLYDRARKPSIRLLPIETRLRDESLASLRELESEWTEMLFDPSQVDSVAAAFEAVRETRRVSIEQATALGLYDAEDPDQPLQPDANGLVEIPRWRHAIVNMPDPLLEQGLVVIDTPGLNAIGNEPELTLNLIPSAQAVLFVLAADAGVTRSDIEVWREHVSPSHGLGRYVVLNKIDGLWDDLRGADEIDREIDAQVQSVARTLSLPATQIYPVSAQKGLAAKVHHDDALLSRSRLPVLEHALSTDLVPRQRAIVRERVEREFNELHSVAHSVLQSRRRHHVEQLFELNSLRGKNRNVVDVMAGRIKAERADFEKGLRQLQALRAVFMRHSQACYATVSIENLRRHTQTAREVMQTSNFSLGLREGMSSLLAATRADFEELGRRAEEISSMMAAMYKRFNAEHGFALGAPMLFSVRRFNTELDSIDALYRNQFGALSLATTERRVLMKRFFESVAARIKDVYTKSHAELEIWLRAVMSPIEGQVREHQIQLRRRLDSVRRVLDASENLETRIAEIDANRSEIEQQQSVLSELAQTVQRLLQRELDAEPELTEVAKASAAFSAVVSAQVEARAAREHALPAPADSAQANDVDTASVVPSQAASGLSPDNAAEANASEPSTGSSVLASDPPSGATGVGGLQSPGPASADAPIESTAAAAEDAKATDLLDPDARAEAEALEKLRAFAELDLGDSPPARETSVPEALAQAIAARLNGENLKSFADLIDLPVASRQGDAGVAGEGAGQASTASFAEALKAAMAAAGIEASLNGDPAPTAEPAAAS